MKLIGPRILCRPINPDRIGAIVLPESVKAIQNYRLWTVLAVGPGRITRKGVAIPLECAVGDRVVTTHYHAAPVELPDGTAILTEDQILAVIPTL